MNSKEYVLNHNFKLGKDPDGKELNKLTLRNIDDLKIYLNDLIELNFPVIRQM